MLAVLGLDVNVGSIKGIDAFDYHLYCNKPIPLEPVFILKNVLEQAKVLIDNLLLLNDLSRASLPVVLFNEQHISDDVIQQLTPLIDDFAEVQWVNTLNDGLNLAEKLSEQFDSQVMLLNVSVSGVAAIVMSGVNRFKSNAELQQSHVYANITPSTLFQYDMREPVSKSLHSHFLKASISSDKIESVILGHSEEELRQYHQKNWLNFTHKSNKYTSVSPTTLLTEVDIIQTQPNGLKHFLSLIAGILCVDQRYRLGTADYPASSDLPTSYYTLENSTSYLSDGSNQNRRVAVSYLDKKNLQLCLVSEVKKQQQVSFCNGFLGLQPVKPVIYFATDIKSLTSYLIEFLQQAESKIPLSFVQFAEQQYQDYCQTHLSEYYCLVLVACSFDTLCDQIQLALNSEQLTMQSEGVWKTPAGSYFSGQRVTTKEAKNTTFLYPGVGALYVGMGRDLLRLFPDTYQCLLALSDNLSHSLQDKLLTPRAIVQPDKAMQLKFEQLLRSDLTNIAEAGVSYAYLLTFIFQQLFGIKATSAAGYSMGEVSMFAALGCWQEPQRLSQRLNKSKVFTEQLSGPLKYLDSVWQDIPSTGKRWESFNLKAGIVQVQSVINDFPRVFITIINTSSSLVIAGDPAQCLALAKKLSLRAIALDVPNIIHCPFAKSEYENIQQLYSLPIASKPDCRLYSSACYLPVPITEKAISVSISRCLTEQVDFPRLIKAIASKGESVFIEMGAGKSLGTWVNKILKDKQQVITCLSVNQKNMSDYSAILKALTPLISLGYQVNLTPFFNGSLIRSHHKKQLQF